MSKSEKTWVVDGYLWLHCPVCGSDVMDCDICDTCRWQNTGPVNIDGGPNYITLAEAQRRWANGEPLRNFFKDQ